MGREIRRVPPNWEHPRDDKGHHKALYDKDYETAARDWVKDLIDWENDKDGERSQITKETGTRHFWWEWDGEPPDREYFRPKFTEAPTHYQIYETVSEGTPDSPVFESLIEMREWLIGNGYSEYAATQFVDTGWAPSVVLAPGHGVSATGIASLDWLKATE
jgi:hypothetical protein